MAETPATTAPPDVTEAAPVSAAADATADETRRFAPGEEEKARAPRPEELDEGAAIEAEAPRERAQPAKPATVAMSAGAPARARKPSMAAQPMAAPAAAPAADRAEIDEPLGAMVKGGRGAVYEPVRPHPGPPYPLPVAKPPIDLPPPPAKRRQVVRATRPYRPLPPLASEWPRDARYRANYLPGRGYLEHLRASLHDGARLDEGASALLQVPVTMQPSWPAPEGRALTVAVDQAHRRLSPTGGETTLRVRVRAADSPPRKRAPLRIHLVIDSSGSMKGAPWQSVCAAVRDIAARLGSEDRLSLTVYDTHGRNLSPAVQGGPAVDAVAARVCAMRPSGNTNIHEGLMTGYEQARAVYDPRAINRVILVSDGIATAGPRDLHTLTMGTVEALGLGITTTVVGLGDEFDALLMGRIAAEGAGNYHFARDHRAVVAVFSDELAVLAQEAAQAVELRVELDPRVELVEVVGSEPLGVIEAQRARQVELATDQRLAADRGIASDRQRDDHRGVRFLMPSFRLGDEHAFFVRVRVPARDGEGAITLANVSLRYKDTLFDRNQHLQARRIGLYADGEDAAEKTRVTDIELGEARARVAHALERGSQYLHARNVPAIRRELYSAASRLTGVADRTGIAAIHAEADRLRKVADLAGLANTPKQIGVLAGVYHYGWRASGLALARP